MFILNLMKVVCINICCSAWTISMHLVGPDQIFTYGRFRATYTDVFAKFINLIFCYISKYKIPPLIKEMSYLSSKKTNSNAEDAESIVGSKMDTYSIEKESSEKSSKSDSGVDSNSLKGSIDESQKKDAEQGAEQEAEQEEKTEKYRQAWAFTAKIMDMMMFIVMTITIFITILCTVGRLYWYDNERG